MNGAALCIYICIIAIAPPPKAALESGGTTPLYSRRDGVAPGADRPLS